MMNQDGELKNIKIPKKPDGKRAMFKRMTQNKIENIKKTKM